MLESVKGKLILADAYSVMREGLKSIIVNNTALRVIGETGNGVELVQLVRQLHPSLLITELALSGINGFEVINEVYKHNPGTRILSVIEVINFAQQHNLGPSFIRKLSNK